MTRPRLRRRSPAEQMFWDRLGPRERVAFTIGFAVGRGADFPRPDMIERLEVELGVRANRRAVRTPGGCSSCGQPLPPRDPRKLGRPYTRCPACRGVAG